ncbi:MAG: hypothetical protein WC552_08445 [Candidatus Omnitrophota bacterium]
MSGKKGQTLLEYTLLLVVILGALLTIQNYFKRGVQGRMKIAVDDLGDQYDPRAANSRIIQRLLSNTETRVTTVNAEGGFWTHRVDYANTIETKEGFINVGGY